MGFFRDLVQRLLGGPPSPSHPPPARPIAGPSPAARSDTDTQTDTDASTNAVTSTNANADGPTPTPAPMPIPSATAPVDLRRPSRRAARARRRRLPADLAGRAEVDGAGLGSPACCGNLWFGRRDLIPPADDERTRLIDRALVTHGLLTPEQLAEIHRVGAEMDRVRPSRGRDPAPGRPRGRGRRPGRPRRAGPDQGREEGRGRRAEAAPRRGRRPSARDRHRVPRPGGLEVPRRPRERPRRARGRRAARS